MLASRAVAVLLDAGLSKSELSAKSSVSRALIDDYLKGRRQPSVAQLARLGESVGFRLEVAWRKEPSGDGPRLDHGARSGRTPSWARPTAAMEPAPTTVAERAQILQRVVDAGLALRTQPPGELMFPPFHTMRTGSDRPDGARP